MTIPSRTFREFARLLAVPLARGLDTDRYLRGLQIVAPPTPQYTNESAVWHREHGFAATGNESAHRDRARVEGGPTTRLVGVATPAVSASQPQ